VVMSASPYRRFAFAFGAAFALFYIVARARGFALFTVYPAQGIVLLGRHRSRDVSDPVLDFLAPEMYWYGWIAFAAVGALAIGLVAALLPDRLCRFWAWCACVVPLIAMIASVYLTIPWFRL
jgi:hypothetical protein